MRRRTTNGKDSRKIPQQVVQINAPTARSGSTWAAASACTAPPGGPVTPAGTPGTQRTPARRKARQLAKYLRGERPDYAYLKDVFRHLRDELGVEVTRAPRKLPYVPPKPRSARSTTPSGKPAAPATSSSSS